MSYDCELVNPDTGSTIELDEPHHLRGGTYALGGTCRAELNVTYNYSEHFYRVLNEASVRSLNGLSGNESIPMLAIGISQLETDVSPDYWAPTEGNARKALEDLLALALAAPHGIWRVE